MKSEITEGKFSKGGLNEFPPKGERPPSPKGQGSPTSRQHIGKQQIYNEKNT